MYTYLTHKFIGNRRCCKPRPYYNRRALKRLLIRHLISIKTQLHNTRALTERYSWLCRDFHGLSWYPDQKEEKMFSQATASSDGRAQRTPLLSPRVDRSRDPRLFGLADPIKSPYSLPLYAASTALLLHTVWRAGCRGLELFLFCCFRFFTLIGVSLLWKPGQYNQGYILIKSNCKRSLKKMSIEYIPKHNDI